MIVRRKSIFGQEYEDRLQYFLIGGVPVINFSDFGRSICSTFKAIKWIPIDGVFSPDDKLIIVRCTENQVFNWCSVYHEYGHIFYNHILDSRGRLAGIEQGIVSSIELEADHYAALKMGKVNMIKWLKSFIGSIDEQIKRILDDMKERDLPENGKILLKRLELNKKEVLLRIKHIEEISD